ncbi:K(+) efflux antiporter 4 isoform X1, partial [Olea europaea subsp. europaea]
RHFSIHCVGQALMRVLERSSVIMFIVKSPSLCMNVSFIEPSHVKLLDVYLVLFSLINLIFCEGPGRRKTCKWVEIPEFVREGKLGGKLCSKLAINRGQRSILKSILLLFVCRLVILIAFLAVLSILSRTFIPLFFKLMIRLSSQTNELYQLASVAFCLIVAWCSDKLGLSLELGSFAAGVMISTTDLAQHTLEQVEPIRNFFAALFLASIGMLIHAHFLWNHIDILLAAVILVIIVKTAVVSLVVKGFGYTNKTSVLVGMSLAQIGEFAFVLLSRASNLHLIEGKLYVLLLGTTALSLVTTPLIFKLIPAVVHLGVLLRWFSPNSSNEIGYKEDIVRADSDKRITLMVQGPRDS